MLPIIDFADFRNGGPDQRQRTARDIGAAFEDIGFVYIRDHGVAPATIEAAQAAARGFFALPEEEKRRSARQPGRYRGYIPVMTFSENAGGRPPVRYEAFLLGADIATDDPAIAASHGTLVPNVWPAQPAGFRAALGAYWSALTELSDELLRCLALALERPEESFLPHFRQPLSNLSLLHYLPRPEAGPQDEDDARAHVDTNALTLVLPGEVGGLQVCQRDGTWAEVPPLPGCFVLNIGNMMECWSGGRFRSTLHRVHPPLGTDRHSIAYFATPDYDTLVEPFVDPVVAEKAVSPIHAGKDFAAFVALFD